MTPAGTSCSPIYFQTLFFLHHSILIAHLPPQLQPLDVSPMVDRPPVEVTGTNNDSLLVNSTQGGESVDTQAH